MKPAQFATVTPMIPAGPRLAEAIAFYDEKFGFEITWQSSSMAGIRRDGVEFNLVENDERAWAENASFSIGVVDLDALYDEYRAVIASLGPLEIKGWGRREFHVIGHFGVCFQFYQTSD